MIKRVVWLDWDGANGTAIDNAALQAVYDTIDAEFERREIQAEEKPTGAGALIAAGLVVAGSAGKVSRRGLLGLSWLSK